MTDEPTVADTVRHAATELHALAARAERKGRSVMLDHPECHAIAASWEHQADDMADWEANESIAGGILSPVVRSNKHGTRHDWTATLAAARALLGEA